MTYSLLNPNTTTARELRKGLSHNGVWGLQKFLHDIDYLSAAPTGDFLDLTETAVRRYQAAKHLTVDGIVGPQTQGLIVHSCVTRAPNGRLLPINLAEGLIQAESGGLLGAVNASVPGGLDLGLTQRRCYGPPFAINAVEAALDPQRNVNDSVAGLLDRYKTYSARVGAGEYAWRLTALAHNWPFAADTLSKGGTISTIKQASWCPASIKADHPWAASWWGWCLFYALGSRTYNWGGLTTSKAFGVPTVR